MTEPAVDPDLQPYGAWYTQPGGQCYHSPEAIGPAVAEAASQLRRLRQSPGKEPPARLVFPALLNFAAAALNMVIGVTNLVIPTRRASSSEFTSAASQLINNSALGIFILVMTIVLVANGVRLLVAPPLRKPETMFRAYLFWTIGAGRSWARRMLLRTDTESDRPRSIPKFMGSATGLSTPESFQSNTAFKRYWRHAFGGKWKTFRITRFKDLRSVLIAPDTAVVEATLVIRARLLWLILLSQAPMLLSFAIFLIVLVTMISTRSYLSDPLAVVLLLSLTVGIGFLLTTVMFLVALVPKEKKQLTVRKILVHVNGQWRIFNGELQGAEEGDVSWLRDA